MNEIIVIVGDGCSLLQDWLKNANPEECERLLENTAGINVDPNYDFYLTGFEKERVAHWDINCDGYYPFCSACGESTVKMSKYCPNCGARIVTRVKE